MWGSSAVNNTALDHRPSSAHSGLTELVLTDHSAQQQALVLSMAAHLSRQEDHRWLTWVTSDWQLASSLRARSDITQSNLRLVYCKEEADHLWMAWDALSLGNSHTVIASPGKLAEKAFSELERAAMIGGAQGILVRARH